MTFGVTPQGFNIKTLEVILDEIQQSQRSAFGPAFNTQADSAAGQLNGIFGDKLAEAWEVLLAVYRALHVDSATGESQDAVAALTGATRLGAAPSTVTLKLNLDPATTVPILSVVSIGPGGARWVTQAAATNAGSDQATIEVEANSEDSAPIVGNAYSIDTIATPISGWSAKAAVTNLNAEPFALVDLQTLLIQVDEGATQTVVFNTADFVSIGAATAQEVIDAIKADTTGIDGLDVTGFIRLFSELDGSGSALRIVGGTAFEALGFSQELIKGFNPSTAAKIINATNETYNMSGSPTLFVAVDGTSSQTITFVDADFGTAATGSIQAIAASLLAVGVDTDGFVLDDGVNPAVTFTFDDDASVVETATLRAIAHNGTQAASQMRTLIVTAINAAPTLAITASPGISNSVIDLVNDATGVAGNVAITETVADVTFTVTGMAGGVNDTPATATAIQVARAITNNLVGGVAYEVGGKVQIESLVVGANSLIEVTGGSANTVLGYTVNDLQGGTIGDAELGRNIETHAEFRIRREQLLRLAGAGTLEATRSAVLNVSNVVQAFVFENFTNFVDAFGRPGKSFEVVVQGGDDTEIAQTIFDKKPLGIESYKVPGPNGVTVAIIDSQGVSVDINFSRPDTIQMHVIADIVVSAAEFGGGSQVDGEQQVREAILAVGDSLQIGQDIVILSFRCAPLASAVGGVAGVLDVTSMLIENVDPPTNADNIGISDRSLATFAIADIDLNVTFV